MIFVDTGYLLALLNPRDALHARAQLWARETSEPLLTTEYVLWEMVNALSHPIDRPKAHAAMAEIGASSGWTVIAASNELLARGLAFHAQHSDKHWSLTDCQSFLVMSDHDIRSALAFDRHFEQAGYEALLRRDP